MERCGVDLSGPWPLSKQGNQYLCVVQDYFSKWIEIFAIPDKTAISVAKCLVIFNGKVWTNSKTAFGFGERVPGSCNERDV